MRILSLSNCPLVETQGSGYVALNFVRGLRQLGHDVDAFGPEDFEMLPRWRRGKNLRLALGMAWYAMRRLLGTRYDVVEFYGGHAWLAATLLNLLPNRRLLMVNHTNGLEPYCELARKQFLPLECSGRPRWLSPPTRLAYTKVDGIVTVSEDERRYAIISGLQDSDRVVAFENPLPDAFLNLPIETDRPPVILYCGSWLPRKGTKAMVADMAGILREFPDYRFRLVGVGDMFRREDFFPPDICDRIEVIPFVSDKLKLRRQYATARIVVVPSIYESFGLVTAEAMALGCAVVTTNTGFGAALRAGREAVIMKERCSPALYEALKELLSAGLLWTRIAAQGHARVQRLQWAPAVVGLEQVYESWLKQRRESLASPILVQAEP